MSDPNNGHFIEQLLSTTLALFRDTVVKELQDFAEYRGLAVVQNGAKRHLNEKIGNGTGHLHLSADKRTPKGAGALVAYGSDFSEAAKIKSRDQVANGGYICLFVDIGLD